MKFLHLIIILSQALLAKAQVVRRPFVLSHPSISTYSKNFVDIFSASANQASLASLKNPSVGIVGEHRFMLGELSSFYGTIAVPLQTGGIGAQVNYFGSSLFNHSQVGLLYGRKINSLIDLGVKFNYNTIKIAGYGNASAVSFETGMIMHLNEKLHTGIHVTNPVGIKMGKNSFEKIESVYRMGFGYEVSKQLMSGIEISKSEVEQISVQAGLQYFADEKFLVRIGLSTGNNNNYGGIGLIVDFGRIDANIAYHPQLGFTPGIALLINLKKPPED